MQKIVVSSLLFAFSISAIGQEAGGQEPKAISTGKGNAAFTFVPVGDDVRVLEEKSLQFYSQSTTGAMEQILPGEQKTGANMDIRDGSMPVGPRMSDMKEESPSAYRCYSFTLSPKENLKLRLRSEAHGKILMRFLPKLKQDAMSGQVRRANNAAGPLRASRIEITNVTDAPCIVALLLYGQANYSYRLEIERKIGS
jgi:hypothetical protein